MQQHLKDQLVELRQCLKALPLDIPVPPATESKYKFSDFSPDAEWTIDIGEAGAVNRELEVRFGNRVNGLKLVERGPETEAVVDVLETWIEKYPGDIILEKWVHDILEAAQSVILAAGKALPKSLHQSNDDPDIELVSSPIKKAKASKKKKIKIVESDASVMHLYTDAEHKPAKGKGGAKVDPLMDQLSVNTYLKSNPKKMIVRCTGAEYGCATTWAAPRWKTRVFGHALQCGKLDKIDLTLRDRVRTAMAKESLGDRVDDQSTLVPGPSIEVPSVGCEPSLAIAPSSLAVSASLKQKSIYPSQRKARIAALKDQLDFDVLKFICIGGIPPTKVDSMEWKTMWKHGNPDYEPASCAVLTESQIPNEAARVEKLQLKHLRTCDNLTITFDGNTTKMPQSVYTVHVITPVRRVFLVEGDESSEVSHTGAKIHEVLRKVMLRVGAEHFSGVASDNTGNTTLARSLLQEEFSWIIILPDSCHRMSSLCKDIGSIKFFQPVIKKIRRTIKYFKNSNIASAHLRRRRKDLQIKKGLVSVGKTRFGTVYHSGESLRRCLTPIRQLCTEKIINIPEVNNYFIDGRFTTDKFEVELRQLLTVLAPIAKAITCLESTHSTVSDVYLFWLAVTATIHQIITEDITGLPTEVTEKIRQAVNYRFNQMVNDAPCDVYLTGFLLDPQFRGADILRDLNPLTIARIKIGGQTNNPQDRELPESVRRMGKFLLSMLRTKYEKQKVPIANLSISEANTRLKDLVKKYLKKVYPFDRELRTDETAYEWWSHLDKDRSNDAQPLARLAVQIFALVPNSMADERTGSTFTWLNSPLRSRQQVKTLVRTVQIRSWYRHDPNAPPPKKKPTVKWRDMSSTIFGGKRKRTKEADDDDGDDHETSDVDDDFADELEAEAVNGDDNGSDSDVTADPEDIAEDGSSKVDSFDGEDFDAASIINLNSRKLVDVLADKDLTPAALRSTVVLPPASTIVQERVLTEADWDME